MIMLGHRQPPRCERCNGLGEVFYIVDADANLCEDCEAEALADVGDPEGAEDDAPGVQADDDEDITEAEYFLILADSCSKLAEVLQGFGRDLGNAPTECVDDPAGLELLESLHRNANFWIETADALIEAAEQAADITERLTNEDTEL